MNWSDSNQQFVNSDLRPPADINYHGLFNQGATCYLNSVLQVLYMTGDFREAVESCTWRNPGSECIDHQLKPLFDVLKRKTAKTSEITDKLGIDRVYEQRDAAVYCERILTLTSPEASQIFQGELTHRTTCSGCCTEMNADGPFWHLPLELVGSYREHYSVVDGIKEHFRTSYLKGENQMYCDKCDAKSDATITCVMKRHPEVLMLLLKRFEFDYSYMTYLKNGRIVDVPCTLQIPENQTYELYAVVDHFGDLRGGHYTATIKSQDDERWYNFNDAIVTLIDNQPFQTDIPDESKSVYLLFYRKRKNTWEAFSSGGFPPAYRDDVRQSQPRQERNEERRDVRGYGLKCERDVMSRVKDEDNDHGRAERKKVSHMHERRDHPQVSGEMRIDKERRHKEVTVAKRRMTEDDELPEKKIKTDCRNRCVKRPSSKGLDIVRHMDNEEGGEHGVGGCYGPKPVTADKRGDDEKMEKEDDTGTRKRNMLTYDWGGEKHRDKRRSDSFRQKRPEQKISVPVSEEKPVRKRKSTGDAPHTQIRKGSSLRQAGLAGRGRLIEKWGDGSHEEMQPEHRSGCERVRKSQRRSGTMRNVKTIAQYPPKDLERDGGNTERELDPKPDVVPLATGVRRMNLNESLLPEPWEHRAKAVAGMSREENETSGALSSRRQRAMKKRREKKRKWWCLPLRQHSGEVKTAGCLSFMRRKRILEQNSGVE